MRLSHSFFLPALAGVASAGSSEPVNAEAYILRQSTTASTSSAPSIPNDLAQAILLQRLSTLEQPSLLGQLSSNEAEIVDYINRLGKPTRPLFAEAGMGEPKQLVIAFSGITDENRKALHAATSSVDLSFTSPRLTSLPIEDQRNCAFLHAIDPKNSKCWDGRTTQYLHYDAAEDAKVITKLGSSLANLKSRAVSGEMETVILLLAQTSAGSEDLRRRQTSQEQVMREDEADTASSTSTDDATSSKPAFSFAASSTVIPSCFTSYDACMSGTSNCSGHGDCGDRFAASGKGNSCFACRCLRTTEKDSKGRESIYHWGGAACQKVDVSTPFWLFVGVTIALLATVTFAVGLLFGVGEEQLPGVIGAGVSRGSK
ncbi:hypothetical protein DL769_004865 [Monosporascus sp. CRB-8-3]|nr:hypothetical protein DL769_004865 [Monosporascus sp. CRB-8-3]